MASEEAPEKASQKTKKTASSSKAEQADEKYCVVHNWQRSLEAQSLVNELVRRRTRKHYGFLEKPVFEGSKRLLFKRLLLVGKAGVGKTSTVHRLLGTDMPVSHEETMGIQISTVYWPVKLEDPSVIITVQLELWDVGERAMATFGHILPSCLEDTDGVVFFFSYDDRHSFDILPQTFTGVLGHIPTLEQTCLLVGTHADCSATVVTEEELEKFENKYKILSLPISNLNSRRHFRDPNAPDGHASLWDIALFMNAVTEVILRYEKHHVKVSKVDRGGLGPLEYYVNGLPSLPHTHTT